MWSFSLTTLPIFKVDNFAVVDQCGTSTSSPPSSPCLPSFLWAETFDPCSGWWGDDVRYPPTGPVGAVGDLGVGGSGNPGVEAVGNLGVGAVGNPGVGAVGYFTNI